METTKQNKNRKGNKVTKVQTEAQTEVQTEAQTEATNDNTNDLSAKEVLNGHFSLAEILAQRNAKIAEIEATKTTTKKRKSNASKVVSKETLMYLAIINKGLQGITFDQIMNMHGHDGNLIFNANTLGMEFNTNDLVLRLEKRFTNPCLVDTKYTSIAKELPILHEKLQGIEVIDNNFDDLQEIAQTINNLQNEQKEIETACEAKKLPIYFEVTHETSKVRFLSNGNGKLNNRVKLLHVSCFKPLYDYLISKNVTSDMVTVTEHDFIIE